MANQTGDTRYGHRAGSGANEPKRHEKKEQAPDWQPRQGGDQTRTAPDEPPERDATGKDDLARDPRSMRSPRAATSKDPSKVPPEPVGPSWAVPNHDAH
jgi:hypothetical protein